MARYLDKVGINCILDATFTREVSRREIKEKLSLAGKDFHIIECICPEDVCPVNFSQKHRDMLMHTKLFLERNSVAINLRFNKLITSLRTAVQNDGSLDKEATSYNDIFDAFGLSLENYSLKRS